VKSFLTILILVKVRRATHTVTKTQQATRIPREIDQSVGASGSRGSSPAGGARAGHARTIVVVLAEHLNSSARSSDGVMVLRCQWQVREHDTAILPQGRAGETYWRSPKIVCKDSD